MENNTENQEKAFYSLLSKKHDSGSPYDYLVLFSGGKDSTYIAHKLKQFGKGRVCLFTVDNGFEEENFWKQVRKVAALLDCDLYTYHPPGKQFIEYYNFLISESSLSKIDPNPLCFLCGRYFIALAVEFAERHNIPFVMYGATPEQINQGHIARTQREIEIFELVSQKYFRNYHEKIQEMEQYRKQPMIKTMIDKVFHVSEKTKVLFPFQYIEYHIENIKKTLEREYGWQNPSEGMSNQKYITSGCRLVSLFGILKKKAGFQPHELDQFDKDFAKDILNEDAYKHYKNLFEEMMKGKIDPEIESLAKKLKVDGLLLH